MTLIPGPTTDPSIPPPPVRVPGLPQTERTTALVIGGGPGGLVALKYLVEDGWEGDEPPVLVEMETEIGGTFRWRGYENAELVSSKQLTCFSDFRYPLSAPDHPSLPNFVQYLNDYVSHFGLWDHVHTGVKVVSLTKTGNEKHPHRAVLRTKEGEEKVVWAKKVVITTGLHVVPNVPSILGLTKPLPSASGSITEKSPSPSSSTSTSTATSTTTTVPWIHSSDYKSRSQLAGKRVLVLGAGETAMDVAYESIMSHSTSVWMGVRTGFLSFPKVLNNFRVLGTTFEGNLPIDGLITNLFETAYVHPYVGKLHVRWFVSDFVIRRLLWCLTGTMAGCNQWAGQLPLERQGRAYVFLNKSAKAMRFINKPHYNLPAWHRWFAHYIDPPLPRDLQDAKIDIVPFPKGFDASGRAVFPPPPAHRQGEKAWKEECRPDLVVLCTGYKQDFDWLGEGYATPDTCDIRGVCSSSDTSVAFIGFLRPGVGAIPPMAEMQAQFFTLLSSGRIPVPTSPETYHLLHAPNGRIQYGVDYSTYMSQLARDMGSAPHFRELYREHGWFVTFVYCFGAAFPTFYRLLGPFKSDLAPEITKTELYESITRRKLAGNIVMGVIPMAFYALVNLAAFLLEALWVLVAPLLGFKPAKSQLEEYLEYRSSASVKKSQ